MSDVNVVQLVDAFADSVVYHEIGKPHSTINTFILIERTAGAPIGLTDHDKNIVIDGVVYYSDGGVTNNNNISNSNLSLDTNELVSLFSQNTITKEQILKWNLDGAKARVFLADRHNPSLQHILREGYLGAIATKNNAFTLEIIGKLYKLNHQVGRTYSASCDTKLFSTRCGLSSASFTNSGTVSSVQNTYILTVNVPSITQPSGWYNSGVLKFNTGPNSNLKLEIKEDTYISGNLRKIELYEAFPGLMSPTESISITAGCDKLVSTCKTKFNNLINFQGFPFISSGEPHGDKDTGKSKTLK